MRCGLHVGVVERRDNDYFGSAVNRAARIMSAAHGGQVLLSQAVVDAASRDRLAARTSTLRDLGAVRLRDLASPERVYQVVHPRCGSDFPALRSLEATPNNLPQQLTSFIGRERELAEVEAAARDDAAADAASAPAASARRGCRCRSRPTCIDDYPDGVWFVELAPLADARLVPQAVASVLGVKEEPGRPVVEALVKHVRDRQLLLDPRQLRAPAAAPAPSSRSSCCRRAPQLKILASSREPLHVAGETTYRGAGARGSRRRRDDRRRDALTQYEAVRLFVERAVAAQPAFRVTDAERARRSPTSAAGSTAFRSRSSSPRRACARCRSKRSPRAWTTASAC